MASAITSASDWPREAPAEAPARLVFALAYGTIAHAPLSAGSKLTCRERQTPPQLTAVSEAMACCAAHMADAFLDGTPELVVGPGSDAGLSGVMFGATSCDPQHSQTFTGQRQRQPSYGMSA
jgi:hypothetical protein